MSEALKVVDLPRNERNADAVEKAKHLLALAEAGEIESFFACGFRAGGDWVAIMSQQFGVVARIGMLESMKFDLLRAADKGG